MNGTGAGTYELWWDAHRPHPTVVVQAHSLPLETAAELGIVGLALLVTGLGGAAAALGRLAGSRDPAWIALLVAAGGTAVFGMALTFALEIAGTVGVWLAVFASAGIAFGGYDAGRHLWIPIPRPSRHERPPPPRPPRA